MGKIAQKQDYSHLLTDLASLIDQGRKMSVQYMNTVLVATYRLIGRRIVEYEQKGENRAEYGEELLVRLADDLSARFGRGFSKSNLFMMRAFYWLIPKSRFSRQRLENCFLPKQNRR
jgi:hypothetical protein